MNWCRCSRKKNEVTEYDSQNNADRRLRGRSRTLDDDQRIRDPKYRRFERGRRAFFETESDNQRSGGDGREDRGKYFVRT